MRKTLLACNVFAIPEAWGPLCSFYGSMSLHLQFYNRSFLLVCACLRECVCVLLTALVCISVSGNDRRERERKVLRIVGEERCVLSAFEEQTKGTERSTEAKLWFGERGTWKKERECEVLKESDVANKKAKVQSKGHPLIYLCFYVQSSFWCTHLLMSVMLMELFHSFSTRAV